MTLKEILQAVKDGKLEIDAAFEQTNASVEDIVSKRVSKKVKQIEKQVEEIDTLKAQLGSAEQKQQDAIAESVKKKEEEIAKLQEELAPVRAAAQFETYKETFKELKYSDKILKTALKIAKADGIDFETIEDATKKAEALKTIVDSNLEIITSHEEIPPKPDEIQTRAQRRQEIIDSIRNQ